MMPHVASQRYAGLTLTCVAAVVCYAVRPQAAVGDTPPRAPKDTFTSWPHCPERIAA
jgi:hypothetical protein